jgi:hypothetical protein
VNLPSDIRDLLAAVSAAIDIPYPATAGDVARHREILAERAMHAAITLRRLLEAEGAWFPTDLAWETAWLREQLTAHPAAGYRTGPWPGQPVDVVVGDAQGGDGR